MTRINVPLDKPEFTALVKMSEGDCRHPREQMRLILREEAKRRGLLPTDLPVSEPTQVIQLEPAQTRSKNQIEQRKIKKKRRSTLKQKAKKGIEGVSNAVLYFVKITASIFTKVVIEKIMLAYFAWIPLEIMRMCIEGLCAYLALKK